MRAGSLVVTAAAVTAFAPTTAVAALATTTRTATAKAFLQGVAHGANLQMDGPDPEAAEDS